jgi:hypothetical protein
VIRKTFLKFELCRKTLKVCSLDVKKVFIDSGHLLHKCFSIFLMGVHQKIKEFLMKKSKCDFKKLALLGIAGGTMLSTQASAEPIVTSELLAFNGCGGASGCQGGSAGGKGGSYAAYRNTPSQNNYYSQQGCQAQPAPSYSQQGCQAQSAPSYSQQGCQAQSAPSYSQQSGCHTFSAPSYSQAAGCQTYSAPRQTQQSGYGPTAAAYHQSTGCHAYSAPQYSNTSQGCGGVAPSQGQPALKPTAPASSTSSASNYSQWETNGVTADLNKANYNPSTSTSTSSSSSNATATTSRPLTESELLSQLNEQGKSAYQGLDSAGKALAVKMANQDCKGQNECKGLNSCKAEDHACAGKGSCAGTAKTNFKDKNLAVKVAALKMAEKRANAASSKK